MLVINSQWKKQRQANGVRVECPGRLRVRPRRQGGWSWGTRWWPPAGCISCTCLWPCPSRCSPAAPHSALSCSRSPSWKCEFSQVKRHNLWQLLDLYISSDHTVTNIIVFLNYPSIFICRNNLMHFITLACMGVCLVYGVLVKCSVLWHNTRYWRTFKFS